MSNEKFVRIIDVPHAMEIISERFDDALELMGNDGLVYGGAIRDIIAGSPIEGDLDIAVNMHTHHKIIAAFSGSPKWTMIGNRVSNDPALPKRLPPIYSTGRVKRPSSLRNTAPKLTRRADPYPGSNIVDTISFETFDSACVQIIRVDGTGIGQADRLDSVLDLVRNVDIRCCALALNSVGKVFELVDGAYIDCKDKVLNVCDIKDPDRFNNLETRIQKLEQRGWTSKIDLMRTNAKLKALRNKIKKKLEKEAKQNTKNWSHGPARSIVEQLIKANANAGAYEVTIKKELENLTHTNIDSEMGFLMRKRGVLASKFGENPEELLYGISSVSHISKVRSHFENILLKTLGKMPAAPSGSISKYQVGVAEELPIPRDPQVDPSSQKGGRVWSNDTWGSTPDPPSYSDSIDVSAGVSEIRLSGIEASEARISKLARELSAEIDISEIGREPTASEEDVAEVDEESVRMLAEGGRLENYKLRTVHKAPPLTAELYRRNAAERRNEKLRERKVAERYDERKLNFSDYIKTRAKKAHKKTNDDF